MQSARKARPSGVRGPVPLSDSGHLGVGRLVGGLSRRACAGPAGGPLYHRRPRARSEHFDFQGAESRSPQPNLQSQGD